VKQEDLLDAGLAILKKGKLQHPPFKISLGGLLAQKLIIDVLKALEF